MDAASHSRLAVDAVTTHRILDERDFKEIIEDLRQHLNRASDHLNIIEREGKKAPYTRIINLEIHVVDLLYFRLRNHLTDWGDPKHHPELSYLGRKRFDEARHDLL